MVLRFRTLLVLVFLLKAPLVWGFSVERTQAYLQAAQKADLAEDPQWLRLGHYHKKLWGGYKSKIRGPFFLAQNASQDPRAELNATITAFFSSTGDKQCRFLARRKWLQKKLLLDARDLLPCPQQEAWKKKLNAQQAYLIFASSDLGSAASSFGHTFLRLHNPQNSGNLDLIDYGVNFAADTGTTDGALFALKGLFGLYPGSYSMLPYHQKIKDYINLEGRDLWEYKMDLSAEQVDTLIDHLMEMEGSYIPYYFADDNCSYELLELIEVVRPDLDLTSHFVDATIPLESLKILGQQKNFLSQERRRPSLQSEFQGIYNHLDSVQKEKLVHLINKVKENPQAEPVKETNALVLEAALNYLAIKEYRDQKNYKEWKYQLSLQRARLGILPEPAQARIQSPLESPDASAFYLSWGSLEQKAVSQIKWRRAFHDLISRDQGVSPFSHMEVLSLNFQYEFQPHRLNLERLQLLKIISTNPVTRLDHPLSWKTSFGTEPQLSPFAEGGAGYSFDFDLGQGSRWVQLLVARAYERKERARLGAGLESIFIQKILPDLRALESVKYLGVLDDKAWFSSAVALSYDISHKIETRLSYERKLGQESVLLSLIF